MRTCFALIFCLVPAVVIAQSTVAGDRVQAPTAPARMTTAPGQTAAQFEVASVKPNTSGDAKVVIQMLPGGRFIATNATLRQLIRNAYQLQEFQITGGPGWLDRDRFDIVAKAEGTSADDPGRGQLMLRALLAERFALTVRIDKRELPIYALVAAKGDGALGPELKPSGRECEDIVTPGNRPACDLRILPGTIAAGRASLAELATGLSPLVGRIVQDRTGLAGRFAFTLRWTPEQMSPGLERKARAMGLPPVDTEGSSLFTAIREQLGLKLDSQKGPVDVLVIDGAERPKEN
jgi:uncharacterized protein (TIGR03435 family)